MFSRLAYAAQRPPPYPVTFRYYQKYNQFIMGAMEKIKVRQSGGVVVDDGVDVLLISASSSFPLTLMLPSSQLFDSLRFFFAGDRGGNGQQ